MTAAPGLLSVPYLSGGVSLPEAPAPSSGWDPSFPPADLVSAALSLLDRPAPVSYGTAPGDRPIQRQPYVLELAPGVLSLFHSKKGGDIDEDFPQFPSRADISGWSLRSRTRFRRRLAELDYSPLVAACAGLPPVMLTLTYPGDWLTVAPSGKVVKRHFAALVKRWARRYGVTPPLLWKLEFQRRGAPHFHILVPVPDRRSHFKGEGPCDCFRCWVSGTWADIVAAPDIAERIRHIAAGTGIDRDRRNSGSRMLDPRRLATYFLKHGSGSAKEYQHCVPEEWREPGKGPGRFWGYRGLDRVSMTMPLTREDYHYLRRVLRRYRRANSRHRTSNLSSRNEAGGWIAFSDAPSLLSRLVPHLPSYGGSLWS